MTETRTLTFIQDSSLKDYSDIVLAVGAMPFIEGESAEDIDKRSDEVLADIADRIQKDSRNNMTEILMDSVLTDAEIFAMATIGALHTLQVAALRKLRAKMQG